MVYFSPFLQGQCAVQEFGIASLSIMQCYHCVHTPHTPQMCTTTGGGRFIQRILSCAISE